MNTFRRPTGCSTPRPAGRTASIRKPAPVPRRLGECRPQRISIGQVNSEAGATTRHFLLMAGIGLDAQIVYQVSAPLKARIGKLAYWLAGWSSVGGGPSP